jgi:hypothetical protein
MEDEIVPEASGRGGQSEATPLQGDHFTILKPADMSDARYDLLAKAICHPLGHPDIFEIESFEMDLIVKPVSNGTGTTVNYGRHRRSKLVASDNKAEVTHRVVFSHQNRCAKPFRLRYRTRKNGCVVPIDISHRNLADAQQLGLHDDYGYDHVFKFIPTAGEAYAITWEVYRGFDPGNRDFHFHFNKPETRSHYHDFRLRLDLTQYMRNGFILSINPTLYYRAQEGDTCEQCAIIGLSDQVRASRVDQSGKWEWRLGNIRRGVLTLRWDFKETE